MADTHTATLLAALSKLGDPPVASETLGLKQQQEAAEGILRSPEVVDAVAVAGQFGVLDIPRLDLGPIEVRPEGAGVQWQWVDCIMRILNAMHQSMGQMDPHMEDVVLDYHRLLHVKLAIQVVSVWGLGPCVPVGIGYPLDKRLAEANRARSPVLKSLSPPTLADEGQRDRRLMYLCRWLLPCAIGKSEVSNVLQTDLLVDLAAALCQLTRPLTQLRKAPGSSLPPVTVPASTLTPDQRRVASQAVSCLALNVRVDMALEALSLVVQSRKAPEWLRRFSTHHLSACLMRPGGVEALLVQTMHAAATPELEMDARAKGAMVLCTWPQHVAPAAQFYAAIAAQVLALLHYRLPQNMDLARRLQRAAVETALRMLETSPKEAPEQLLRLLFGPFVSIMQGGSSEGQVVVGELALYNATEDLHRLFVAAKRGDHPPASMLGPIVPALFQLYCYTRRTPANLKTACSEVLVEYFKRIDNSTGVDMLLALVLPYTKSNSPLDLRVAFSVGAEGGIVVTSTDSVQRDFGWECESVVELLQGLQRSSLAGDYFVRLVDEFMELADSGLAAPPKEKGPNFLDGGQAHDEEAARAQRYMVVLQSVLLLVERVKGSMLQNVKHVVVFAKVLANSPDPDTVAMALGLLSTMLGGAVDVSREDEGLISELHGWLEPFTHHPEAELREIALDLRTSIRTRDPQWHTVTAQQAKQGPSTPLAPEDSKVMAGDETLPGALELLRDPLLPARAHALIALRRLIRQRDPATVDNVDRLLEVFEEQLRHSDSYLYLAAIAGLATLCATYPRSTIYIVTKHFADPTHTEDDRLKYGEVLSQLVAEAQPTVLRPYLPDLVPALLRAAATDASEDPAHKGHAPPVAAKNTGKNSAFVVASALSTLAKICLAMGTAMHLFLNGIVDVVVGNMDKYVDDSHRPMVSEIGAQRRPVPPPKTQTDTDEQLPLDEKMEVRRGAMHLVSLLFRGLGPDTLRLLGARMRPIYEQLRHTAASDPDETTRQHAEAALAELDDIIYAVFGLSAWG